MAAEADWERVAVVVGWLGGGGSGFFCMDDQRASISLSASDSSAPMGASAARNKLALQPLNN